MVKNNMIKFLHTNIYKASEQAAETWVKCPVTGPPWLGSVPKV